MSSTSAWIAEAAISKIHVVEIRDLFHLQKTGTNNDCKFGELLDLHTSEYPIISPFGRNKLNVTTGPWVFSESYSVSEKIVATRCPFSYVMLRRFLYRYLT